VTCEALKSFQSSTARVSFLYSSDVVSQVVNAQSHKLHNASTPAPSYYYYYYY